MSVPVPTVLIATIGMEYVAPARMPRELKAAGFRVALLAPEGAWATRTQYLDVLAHIPQRASLATWADVMLQLQQKIDPAHVLPGDDATMRALMTIAATVPADVPPSTRDAILPVITRSLGDPDHYTQRFIGADPHYNSTIASYAYYLAIEGGTDRTSGRTVQGVGAANREQIEKSFFRALTALMPSSSTFATARVTTIQAARDLYGGGSAAERASPT